MCSFDLLTFLALLANPAEQLARRFIPQVLLY
jgi:hypothetical protein